MWRGRVGLDLGIGALVGYARVSTCGQRLDRQLAALNAAGCARIFADKKTGKNAEREALWKALDYLRPGDTLVVPSLDRLGRSLADLPSNPERPTDSARRDHLFQTTTY